MRAGAKNCNPSRHDSETYTMTQHCTAGYIRVERRHIDKNSILLFCRVEDYKFTDYRYHNCFIGRSLGERVSIYRCLQIPFCNQDALKTSLLPTASVHYKYGLEGC